MNIVESMKNRQVNEDIPDFNVGDTIRFRVKVVEGNKERYQPFQGTVIQMKGSGGQETFTVRKISGRGTSSFCTSDSM